MGNKKLFLASFFKDVAALFANFAGDLNGKSVTFIPTASLVESVTFYVASGKKALEKMGLEVDTLEISTASAQEIEHTIMKNDFIYLTGGNSFYLLQELKRTGADLAIKAAVQSGKLYIGESAGAIAASPSIGYVEKMDSIKKAPLLSEYTALGLVDFYTVPHHTNAPFKKTVETILATYSEQLPLKAISNKEAILVQGDSVKTEGIKKTELR